MSDTSPEPVNRGQRVLAYMIAALVLSSLGCFLAVIIGTAAGAGDDGGFGAGAWPTVISFPLLGLPVALLLTVALLVITGIRRSRANRGR